MNELMFIWTSSYLVIMGIHDYLNSMNIIIERITYAELFLCRHKSQVLGELWFVV